MKEIKEYLKQNKEVYLPYVSEKFGVEPKELSKLLVDENCVFKDNLLVFDYDKEIPNWIEVCDTKYRRGKVIPADKVEFYSQNNQKGDQHISVYKHDETWRRYSKANDNVRCNTGNISPQYIYLELDRDTLKEAAEDALKIYDRFPYNSHMSFWFSGNKSVHIEVDARLFGWHIITKMKETAGFGKLYYNLAHKIAGDIRWNNSVDDVYTMSNTEVADMYEFTFGEKGTDLQKMKKRLENIDPNIYSKNSLIRQKYSYHEKGKKQKSPLGLYELCAIAGVSNQPYSKTRIHQELKPYLLHWTFECYEPKIKKSTYKPTDNEEEIIKVFSEAFEYFNPDEADGDGWVRNLRNPMYEDTNPDVSVNINTGYLHDFGSQDYQIPFHEFKKELKEKGII